MSSQISIHALLAESDFQTSKLCNLLLTFLSTLSLRRATVQIVVVIVDALISIHALLAESDPGKSNKLAGSKLDFYPRSPCGERHVINGLDKISTIHFYPRSPCGERPVVLFPGPQLHRFLSTLSLRRATPALHLAANLPADFYPRSPCGERRQSRLNWALHDFDFYPRSPCGERLKNALSNVINRCISIHALLAESD